jgi:hypothetical protein
MIRKCLPSLSLALTPRVSGHNVKDAMTKARVGPDPRLYFSQGKGLLTLWAGILLPPLAWFLHQQLSYVLVP